MASSGKRRAAPIRSCPGHPIDAASVYRFSAVPLPMPITSIALIRKSSSGPAECGWAAADEIATKHPLEETSLPKSAL